MYKVCAVQAEIYRLQAEIYRSQAEIYRLQAEIYRLQAEIYRSQAEIYRLQAEIYRLQAEGCKTKPVLHTLSLYCIYFIHGENSSLPGKSSLHRPFVCSNFKLTLRRSFQFLFCNISSEIILQH